MENSSEVKQFIFNFSSKEDEFSLNISYNVLKNHKRCKKFFKSKNIVPLLEKTNFETRNPQDFQLQINRNAISNVQISTNRKPQISRKLQTNTLAYSFQAKVRIAKENIVQLMCQALYAVALIILANVLIYSVKI